MSTKILAIIEAADQNCLWNTQGERNYCSCVMVSHGLLSTTVSYVKNGEARAERHWHPLAVFAGYAMLLPVALGLMVLCWRLGIIN